MKTDGELCLQKPTASPPQLHLVIEYSIIEMVQSYQKLALFKLPHKSKQYLWN